METKIKKIILMCGLPGSGKTTTALRISHALIDCFVISRSNIRNPYKGNGCLEEYAKATAEIVDRMFYAHVKELFSLYSTVILDATFREWERRNSAIEFAQKHNCQLFVIECICSKPMLLQRLKHQILTGEKNFIKPPEEVLEYYIKDTQSPENELESISFIQLDTEKNCTALKSSQFHTCQSTMQLIEILDQPFDPSTVESFPTIS